MIYGSGDIHILQDGRRVNITQQLELKFMLTLLQTRRKGYRALGQEYKHTFILCMCVCVITFFVLVAEFTSILILFSNISPIPFWYLDHTNRFQLVFFFQSVMYAT